MICLPKLIKKNSGIALLDRNVKLIIASSFVFYFGDGFYIFTLPIYIRQLNVSASQTGLLYALFYLGFGLSILIGGYLASKYDNKKIILASSLACLPLPVILIFASDWTQLILPLLLYGGAFGLPAICNLLISSTSSDRVMLTFGLWSLSQSLSYVIAPFFGGYITLVIGKESLFFCAFAFYFISIIPLILLKKNSQKDSIHEPIGQFSEGTKNKKKVILISIIFCIIMFQFYLVNPLIPQFESGVYHQNMFNLGILGTMTFAGWAFFSFFLGKIGDSKNNLELRALTTALIFSILSFSMILIFQNFILLALASFLSGASYTILYLLPGLIRSAAPKESMVKWVSICQASVCFVGCLGALIGGRIYEIWIYLPFLIAVVALIGIVIIITKNSALFKKIIAAN